MTQKDIVSSALSKIYQYEKLGRKLVELKPVSKLLKEILKIMNEEGYVGTFQEVEDGRGNYLKLSLLGRINKCGSIKPRFSIKIEDFTKKEQRYLPARGFGIMILSTPKGIMAHKKAFEQKTGGSLLAYCY
jgi:small subunit ribosomal protein S8